MPSVDLFSLNLLRYSGQVFCIVVTVGTWSVSTVLMYWMFVDVQGLFILNKRALSGNVVDSSWVCNTCNNLQVE